MRHLLALCLLALALPPTPSGAQVFPPAEGSIPRELRDAMRQYPRAFQTRRGFKTTVAQLAENRRLLAEGKLTGDPGKLARMTSVSGNLQVPVLLGRFTGTPDPPYDAADFRTMLFDGPWPTGTMRDYYDEISYGALNLYGGVHEWVDTGLTREEVVGNSAGTFTGLPSLARTDQWIHATLAASDPNIGFAAFDNDGPDGFPNSGDDDGFVDFIALVHPLNGGESNLPGSGIWSHRSALSVWSAGPYVTNDPSANGGFITVDDYTIMPAFNNDLGGMVEIGVFCHEFGHAFGLPDLYDIDKVDEGSAGIGYWGLMGSGASNTRSRPAHMSAWSKMQLGWITPGLVTNDLFNWNVASSTTTPTAFRMWKDGAVNTEEYFLVEYRRALGFDENLRGEGLLIWHVDESRSQFGNGDETHKLLDLECADQMNPDHVVDADDLDVGGFNAGDAGDPFCDGDIFSPTSQPSSVTNSGAQTGVRVEQISECGTDNLRATLRVGVQSSFQDLCVRDCTTDTCFEPSSCDVWWASPDVYIDNNEDGIIDPPAERIPNKLFVNVQNIGAAGASDVTVDFYQAEAAAGLIWPGTAQHIGSDEIPAIDGAGSGRAMIQWNMPQTPPYADHWCLGAIATNAADGQSTSEAFWDNNVTQINVQELFAKAGTQAPVAATEEEHAAQHQNGKKAEPFFITRTIQLCNPLWSPDCNAEVYLGSPPNFDDVVLPPGWDAGFDSDVGSINFGECVSFDVFISSQDAHHLDQAIIPLTLYCGGELMGGNILKVNIDNFRPQFYCDPFQVNGLPLGSDDFPSRGSIRVEWIEIMQDIFGWSDRVERWAIYRDSFPTFTPGPQNLLLETCIDENPGTLAYEHFADPPTDVADTFYKIVAIDRAGNQTISCAKQVRYPWVTEAPPQPAESFTLAQNSPNPFNPATGIRFTLPRAGVAALEIFNPRGERVRILNREALAAGPHHLIWDGRDDAGRSVASGVYVYRLVFEGRQDSKSMLLLK